MATWPTSRFARPQGSFNLPVPPPVPAGGLCNLLQVQFPAEWLPYILSALEQLTLQATWQGSTALVEQTQEQAWTIIRQFSTASCVGETPASTAMCCEDDMGCGCFRVQDGQLQQFCCGEWVNIDGAVFNQGGQPGPGTPPPAPGGGKQTYCMSLSPDGRVLLPAVVNSGDTILIRNVTGAWEDADNPVTPAWRCFTGGTFFAGACFPSFVFDAGAPLPAVPEYQLIARIGSTLYPVCNLDLSFNPQPFVVPPGHTNDQVVFLCNNDNPVGDAGEISFCTEVTNNQAAPWSHTFDFTISDYSAWWSIITDAAFTGTAGTYVPGAGYLSALVTDVPAGRPVRIIRIKTPFAVNFDTIEMNFTFIAGTLDPVTQANTLYISDYNTAFLYQVASPTVPGSPYNAGSGAAPHDLELALIPGADAVGDPGGSATIHKMTITGHGADPFA